MKTEEGILSFEAGEREGLIQEAMTHHFPHVGFKHIEDHVGLRKGKLHVLLAPTGSGKSTLTRSLLFSFLGTTRVMWYATEESRKEMKTWLAAMRLDDERLQNLRFIDETEDVYAYARDKTKDPDTWASRFESFILDHRPEIIILDNITTSKFYENSGFEHQGKVSALLKEIAIRHGVALYVVAHTKAGIKESQKKPIGPDDIRGSKSIANLADFFYIIRRLYLKTISTDTASVALIQILKARHLKSNQGAYYSFRYDHGLSIFTTDKKINFSELKDLFKESNSLE